MKWTGSLHQEVVHAPRSSSWRRGERWRDRDMHPCQWLVLKGGVNMDSTAAAGGSCTFPDFIFVFVRNKLTISRSKTLPSSKSRFVENIWTDFNLRFVFFNFFPGHRANSTTCAKIGSAARPVTCSRLVVHDKQIAEVSPACMHWPQNNNKVHGSI